MLDYILSKMVLLIFLLLLVSAFTLVQQSLDSYFAQQAAKGLAKGIAADISLIVTTVRSSSEVKIYALPPVLEAGNRRIPYDINVIVYRRQDPNAGTLCYIGILVLDQGRSKPLAFDTVAVGKPDDVDVYVCYQDNGVFARSSGLKDQYLILDRTLDFSTGKMTLKMCSSSDPNGGCDSCGGSLC